MSSCPIFQGIPEVRSRYWYLLHEGHVTKRPRIASVRVLETGHLTRRNHGGWHETPRMALASIRRVVFWALKERERSHETPRRSSSVTLRLDSGCLCSSELIFVVGVPSRCRGWQGTWMGLRHPPLRIDFLPLGHSEVGVPRTPTPGNRRVDRLVDLNKKTQDRKTAGKSHAVPQH